MKKVYLILAAFALLTLGMVSCDRNDDTTDNQTGPSVGGFDQNGASNALFSVAPGRTVRFSKGNLQYQASTGTWRFAEHQYDIIGEDNENISSTYTGWIDLFGFGTSGWNSGVNCYQPWSSSEISNDYSLEGRFASMQGDYARSDWGIYNAISNGGNQAGLWRTLTCDEWEYLFHRRPNAKSKCGLAKVAGKKGFVILPDSWSIPSGLTFNSGDAYDEQFSANTYTCSEWAQMESAGAIFLPDAGQRYGRIYEDNYNNVCYWTSTCTGTGYNDNFSTSFALVHTRSYTCFDFSEEDPSNGLSVRLVQVASSSAVGGFDQNGASKAVFSVDVNKTVRFSKGNLQYNTTGSHTVANGGTATGTWRFAENQYDIIGSDNENICPTYTGWIDLFGSGTSGWNSGAQCYQPWSSSSNDDDYLSVHIDQNAYVDWGIYNAISNGGNQAGLWRVLTDDEADYLLRSRFNCEYKFGGAIVNGQAGIVVLPDDWTHPSGIATGFIPARSRIDDCVNIYNSSEWSIMESAGAIFLPYPGYRYRGLYYYNGTIGWYYLKGTKWYNPGAVLQLYPEYFSSQYSPLGGPGSGNHTGLAVRLVKDTE